MKEQLKEYFIVFYSDPQIPLSSLENTLSWYDIPAKLKNEGSNLSKFGYMHYADETLVIENYFGKAYEVKFFASHKFLNRFANADLIKNDLQNISEIDQSYFKITLTNGYYQEEDQMKGFARLLFTVCLYQLNKPIFHSNLLSETELNELRALKPHQLFTRLDIANYCDKPDFEKIPESEVVLTTFEISQEARYVGIGRLQKKSYDALSAWYAIGIPLCGDAWEITNSNFTPITFKILENDLEKLKYSDTVKNLILSNLNERSTITRVHWEMHHLNSTYFCVTDENYIGFHVYAYWG